MVAASRGSTEKRRRGETGHGGGRSYLLWTVGALGLAHGIAFSASYQLVRGPALVCWASISQWHLQQSACTCAQKVSRCGLSAAVDKG